MPNRNTRMVCCRRCKNPNFIYKDGPDLCEVCGEDLLTDGIDWDFDSKEDEEHSGTCTNQGPVISTGHAHRVYRSGCNDDCGNCEFWQEYEKGE